MKKANIPDQERRIIANLYWNQKAVVRTRSDTEKIKSKEA